MTGYGLILPFDRDGDADEPFAMGFECGRLWEIAKANADEFTQNVHVENAEMVLRIGESLMRPVSSNEIGDGWIEVTFGVAE